MKLLIACMLAQLVQGQKQPNFIFILTDDQGWGDIGYHNKEVITPHLDDLATNGVRLENYYTQPVCSPSRGSLLTGMYPFHIGMQHDAFAATSSACCPTSQAMLPEILKSLGYKTHLIGKWHLGFCNIACTPLERGFDTFNGFFTSTITHFHHINGGGYDFRNGTDVDYNEIYTTTFIKDTVIEQIEASDGTPFFSYVSFLAPHAPLQAEEYYLNHYSTIEGDRKKYLAMVTAVDDAVGEIMDAVWEKGLQNNTYIFFASDNGGEPPGSYNGHFRGAKQTIWEGGVRTPAFVYSELLPEDSRGTINNGLFHVSDWFPTMVYLAGGTPDAALDGVDQRSALHGGPPSRDHIIIQMDSSEFPHNGQFAVRKDDYKFIVGYPGYYDGWMDDGNLQPLIDIVFQGAPHEEELDDFSKATTAAARMKGITQLYNVADDPEERHELSDRMPKKVDELLWYFRHAKWTEVEPLSGTPNSEGDAANFGGVWSPGWC